MMSESKERPDTRGGGRTNTARAVHVLSPSEHVTLRLQAQRDVLGWAQDMNCTCGVGTSTSPCIRPFLTLRHHLRLFRNLIIVGWLVVGVGEPFVHCITCGAASCQICTAMIMFNGNPPEGSGRSTDEDDWW